MIQAEQITTLTFIKYENLSERIWAFGMMQFAHRYMQKADGLLFYKLLGSGKSGFNPMPDWTVYALLQVWESEEKANLFFEGSPLMEKYRSHSVQVWTLYMKNTMARGKWSGKNPFIRHPRISEDVSCIAVITRATIKYRYLKKFWKSVPAAQGSLQDNAGLIFTKGVGEVPFLQMATFSLWKDQQALDAYAYRSKEHVKVIGDTRKLGWYREEMFSRFQPYRSEGSWHAVDPSVLGTLLSDQNQTKK